MAKKSLPAEHGTQTQKNLGGRPRKVQAPPTGQNLMGTAETCETFSISRQTLLKNLDRHGGKLKQGKHYWNISSGNKPCYRFNRIALFEIWGAPTKLRDEKNRRGDTLEGCA
ncbi:hypothetical protein [Anthocerotibacter panamensis]|uniref:hypothetical protein n=1 Tax=Anthocerotibacter panamensis TaxID=2857077 RepID=UPI001C404625|nr:hypothetical protein [Anthocerotibacter panamensis]